MEETLRSEKLKPLIKWSGGKHREIELFRKYYPEEFDVYIEPFVGGGSVFFDLRHNKNVIADVHTDLINFYKVIGDAKGDLLYNILSNFKNNEEMYYYIRDEYEPSDNIEKAARFFYLRKTCFRGMLRYNKDGHFNIPYGRYKNYNIDILKDNRYCELLRNTIILNIDFINIFSEFNDKNNFMFIDPPYDSVFTDYGNCRFSKEHHIKLAKIFKTTKNKCLIIIGETAFIKELYKDFIVDRYHKKYAFKIHSNRVDSNIDNYHLVIKNY